MVAATAAEVGPLFLRKGCRCHDVGKRRARGEAVELSLSS
jgi:hypothetical protein